MLVKLTVTPEQLYALHKAIDTPQNKYETRVMAGQSITATRNLIWIQDVKSTDQDSDDGKPLPDYEVTLEVKEEYFPASRREGESSPTPLSPLVNVLQAMKLFPNEEIACD